MGTRKVISGVEEIWRVQFSISWQTEETDRALSVGPNVEAGGWSENGEGAIGGKRFPPNGPDKWFSGSGRQLPAGCGSLRPYHLHLISLSASKSGHIRNVFFRRATKNEDCMFGPLQNGSPGILNEWRLRAPAHGLYGALAAFGNAVS